MTVPSHSILEKRGNLLLSLVKGGGANGIKMVNLIRWLSLIILFVVLYLLGRNSFHLKDAETFFVLVFSFCCLLTIVFTLTRER